MVLYSKNNNISLEHLKHKLQEFKNRADTAKAQEEYSLKQLKNEFECDTLEEAEELLEELIAEKETLDKEITEKTDILLERMEKEGINI